MKHIKKAIRAFQVMLENEGKARALARLRAIDPRVLAEYGISPQALDQGIKAWPWRQPESAGVTRLDAAIKGVERGEPANDDTQKFAA